MKEFICIECPKGCHLKVDDDLNVTGNTCPRGKVYAINEKGFNKLFEFTGSRVVMPVKDTSIYYFKTK